MIDTTTDSLVPFHVAARRLAVTNNELIAIVRLRLIKRPIKIAGALKFFASDIDGFLARLYRIRQRNPRLDVFTSYDRT